MTLRISMMNCRNIDQINSNSICFRRCLLLLDHHQLKFLKSGRQTKYGHFHSYWLLTSSVLSIIYWIHTCYKGTVAWTLNHSLSFPCYFVFNPVKWFVYMLLNYDICQLLSIAIRYGTVIWLEIVEQCHSSLKLAYYVNEFFNGVPNHCGHYYIPVLTVIWKEA